jgi:hypothetical protein
MSGGQFVAALILAVAGVAHGQSGASGTPFDADEYLAPGWVVGPGRLGTVTGAGKVAGISGPGKSGTVRSIRRV